MPWYAFGKTPKQIAEKVATLCVRAKRDINTSDLSRQDGRISPALRTFERKLLLRGFNRGHAKQIIDLHNAQYNLKASTRAGVKYDTGTSRASGSSETSDLNTDDTSFFSYYAFRLDTDESLGMTPQQAWDALGLYGGDDAVNVDLDPLRLARAARAVGQVVKSNVIRRGESGVNFLARYYSPGVWEGAPDTCCDFTRQMVKFHTTVNLTGYTPEQKLLEKCQAYYLTDAHTPFIGRFCAKVLHLADIRPEDVDPSKLNKVIVPYYSRYDFKDQFPNQNVEDWMDDLIHSQVPDFPVREALEWIDSLKTLKQCLAPPLMAVTKLPADVVAPVVINGDIHHPKSCAKPDSKPKGKPFKRSKAQTKNKPTHSIRRRKPGTVKKRVSWKK